MHLDPTFDRSFRALYGKPCWNVRPGYGSFITLEFGEPGLEIREPQDLPRTVSKRVRDALARRQVTVRGEWHLFIYCCEWRVYSCRKFVGDSSSRRAIREATDYIDSQALTEVSFSYRGCRSIFEFDLGARLITKPYDTDSEQWMLYQPTGKVLTLRADRMFTHQSGNTLPDSALWRPAWSG